MLIDLPLEFSRRETTGFLLLSYFVLSIQLILRTVDRVYNNMHFYGIVIVQATEHKTHLLL